MLKITALLEKLTSEKLKIGDGEDNKFSISDSKEIAKKSKNKKLSKLQKLFKFQKLAMSEKSY